MTDLPYVKASYTAPFNDVYHLHAIMNDPCPQGLCLVINISSIKPDKYHDSACVLAVGEHKLITRASFVYYKMANTSSASHIKSMVEKKYYLAKDDWSELVFSKISLGLFNSGDVPKRIIDYAKTVGIPCK